MEDFSGPEGFSTFQRGNLYGTGKLFLTPVPSVTFLSLSGVSGEEGVLDMVLEDGELGFERVIHGGGVGFGEMTSAATAFATSSAMTCSTL